MPALVEVLASISGDLPAGTTWHIGEEWIRREEAPPRVVWIPRSETYRMPEGQGGDETGEPRPLRTRVVSVEAHLWAASIDSDGAETSAGANLTAIETLLNGTVQAISKHAWGSFEGSTGQWVFADGANIKLGVVYVFAFELRIPVPRVASTTATILTMPTTYKAVVPEPDGTEETILTTP